MNKQPLRSSDSTINTEITPISLTENKAQLQTIVLFDWDNTLFCTDYVKMHNLNYNTLFSFEKSSEEVCSHLSAELKLLEQVILSLFYELTIEREAKVYIVSNAKLKRIQNWLIHFLPELNVFIQDMGIKIYSAKNLFSSSFSSGNWKAKCFRMVLDENYPDLKSSLRILSVGDSKEEKKASLEISSIKDYSQINVSFLQMIKAPSLQTIVQQLTFITDHFDDIISRKEFLHQLSYEDNNQSAELKYNIIEQKELPDKILKKKRDDELDQEAVEEKIQSMKMKIKIMIMIMMIIIIMIMIKMK